MSGQDKGEAFCRRPELSSSRKAALPWQPTWREVPDTPALATEAHEDRPRPCVLPTWLEVAVDDGPVVDVGHAARNLQRHAHGGDEGASRGARGWVGGGVGEAPAV